MDFNLRFLYKRYDYSEVQGYIIDALLMAQDYDQIEKLIVDWGFKKKEYVSVSKFDPGEHYHCLGVKFNTLEDAKKFIEEEGCVYNGLKIVYVRDALNGD